MNWKNHKTAALDKTKVKFLEKYLIGKTVLDIGCATGIYTDFILKKGFEVLGVDESTDLLKKARQKYKCKFLKVNIENAKFKNNQFDASIIFDVLEHVDDVAAIKNIAKFTSRRIIGSVPRTTDVELRNNYLLFGHHKDTTHLRTYTANELKKLFKNIKYKRIVIKKTHKISTESMLIDILEGKLYLKKIIRKTIFIFLKPKVFYSNLIFIVELR